MLVDCCVDTRASFIPEVVLVQYFDTGHTFSDTFAYCTANGRDLPIRPVSLLRFSPTSSIQTRICKKQCCDREVTGSNRRKAITAHILRIIQIVSWYQLQVRD